SRHSESANRTMPVRSHSSAYRSRSRRERISSKTTSSRTNEAIAAAIVTGRGVIGSPFLLHRDGVTAKEPDEDREQDLRHVVDRAGRGDRGAAAAALAHRDGHLLQAQLVLDAHHGRLDLGVV